MTLNDAATTLVARMARREAAARRRQLTTLDEVEQATDEAFEAACNGDQAMGTLRWSEAAQSYFATVFFGQFGDL